MGPPTLGVFCRKISVEDIGDLREWLDNVFALDVLDKLDDEVVNGTGTGGRMLGVRLCPGLASPIAFTAPETAADAIARGISAVYTASRLAPDAIVIDPGAYTTLLTLKASTSGVYGGCHNRDGSSPTRKAPYKLFHETDLYTITGVDGERNLTLEHGLSGLEGSVVAVGDNVLAQKAQRKCPRPFRHGCSSRSNTCSTRPPQRAVGQSQGAHGPHDRVGEDGVP